jgi:hypothetical protein
MAWCRFLKPAEYRLAVVLTAVSGRSRESGRPDQAARDESANTDPRLGPELPAELIEANLCQTNLSQAILFDADLSHASLRRANLGLAYMEQANLGGARLQAANLQGANLEGAELDGVHYNSEPFGLAAPSARHSYCTVGAVLLAKEPGV